MQLRSHIAVAVVQANSYSSDSMPSLGTSICFGCSPKRPKNKLSGVSIVAQWVKNLTMSTWIWIRSLASFSALRIQHCRKLLHRSHMWFRSCVAVAQACSCSSDSTPSPGTWACHRCNCKMKKKKLSGHIRSTTASNGSLLRFSCKLSLETSQSNIHYLTFPHGNELSQHSQFNFLFGPP